MERDAYELQNLGNFKRSYPSNDDVSKMVINAFKKEFTTKVRIVA
jgi:hypothetical protein